MERWSVQHRMAVLELFIKTESFTATHHGFRQKFQYSAIVGIEMAPRRTSDGQ